MRILLFTGAGTSVPSNLPSTKEITESLLNGSWRYTRDPIIFHPHDGTARHRADPTDLVQSFLKLLKSYADGFYALRSGRESNYEDLFYLAKQIWDDSENAVENPAIGKFIDELKDRTADLQRAVPFERGKEFVGLATLACSLIRGVVFHMLSMIELSIGDIKDLQSFTSKLIEKSDAVSDFLNGHVDHDLLTKWQEGRLDPADMETALMRNLNKVIRGVSIHDAKRFASVTLRTETQKCLTQKPRGRDMARLNRLLLEDAYEELSREKKIEGLDLLRQLAVHPDVTKLDICTLNHDLLIEKYLQFRNVLFNDGFCAEMENVNVRFYDYKSFDVPTKVRLFKLHGSIDWYRFKSKLDKDAFQKFVSCDPQHCENETFERATVAPEFLIGTYNKLAAYEAHIFADLHHWFHRLLRGHDIILISGYGWGDGGINQRLLEWVLRSPKNRMVLMQKQDEISFKDLLRESLSIMAMKQEKKSKENWRVYLTGKWMCCTRVEEIFELLNC